MSIQPKITSAEITSLPNEIILNIFTFLEPKDIAIVRLVSKKMKLIADTEWLWKRIYEKLDKVVKIAHPKKLFSYAPFSFKWDAEYFDVRGPAYMIPNTYSWEWKVIDHFYPNPNRYICHIRTEFNGKRIKICTNRNSTIGDIRTIVAHIFGTNKDKVAIFWEDVDHQEHTAIFDNELVSHVFKWDGLSQYIGYRFEID